MAKRTLSRPDQRMEMEGRVGTLRTYYLGKFRCKRAKFRCKRCNMDILFRQLLVKIGETAAASTLSVTRSNIKAAVTRYRE